MDCLFMTPLQRWAPVMKCYSANAAVSAWVHYSRFHHYPQLILKTASAASARATQLSLSPLDAREFKV